MILLTCNIAYLLVLESNVFWAKWPSSILTNKIKKIIIQIQHHHI